MKKRFSDLSWALVIMTAFFIAAPIWAQESQEQVEGAAIEDEAPAGEESAKTEEKKLISLENSVAAEGETATEETAGQETGAEQGPPKEEEVSEADPFCVPINHILYQELYASQPLDFSMQVNIEQDRTGLLTPRPKVSGSFFRPPEPEYAFIIVRFRVINLPPAKVVIKSEDIWLEDISGKRWEGFFWAPLINEKEGVWVGSGLEVSSDGVKINSSSASLEIGQDVQNWKTILPIPRSIFEISNKIEGDAIEMLFEVPRLQIPRLKLILSKENEGIGQVLEIVRK